MCLVTESTFRVATIGVCFRKIGKVEIPGRGSSAVTLYEPLFSQTGGPSRSASMMDLGTSVISQGEEAGNLFIHVKSGSTINIVSSTVTSPTLAPGMGSEGLLRPRSRGYEEEAFDCQPDLCV